MVERCSEKVGIRGKEEVGSRGSKHSAPGGRGRQTRPRQLSGRRWADYAVDRSAVDRSEGAGALLSGWWPAYCRLAPHAILTFPLLEQMRRVAGLENF